MYRQPAPPDQGNWPSPYTRSNYSCAGDLVCPPRNSIRDLVVAAPCRLPVPATILCVCTELLSAFATPECASRASRIGGTNQQEKEKNPAACRSSLADPSAPTPTDHDVSRFSSLVHSSETSPAFTQTPSGLPTVSSCAELLSGSFTPPPPQPGISKFVLPFPTCSHARLVCFNLSPLPPLAGLQQITSASHWASLTRRH